MYTLLTQCERDWVLDRLSGRKANTGSQQLAEVAGARGQEGEATPGGQTRSHQPVPGQAVRQHTDGDEGDSVQVTAVMLAGLESWR